MIDSFMVLFSLIYNAVLILVFVLRGKGRRRLEEKLGPIFNALLVPFSFLWLLNLIGGRDIGRLITGMPVIVFLVYDLMYRTVTRKKPYHHPERWPLGLYAYVLVYQLSSIMMNGYAFMVSRLHGYIVLTSFFGNLAAYFYYQHKYKKTKARSNAPPNDDSMRISKMKESKKRKRKKKAIGIEALVKPGYRALYVRGTWMRKLKHFDKLKRKTIQNRR